MSEQAASQETEQPESEPEQIVTLAELQAAPPTREYTIPLPALGKGKVAIIRNLTHQEVRQIYDRNTDRKGAVDTDGVERNLVCWASVNPKITPDSYGLLVRGNAALIRQYVQAILDVSGLSPDSLAAAKARFRG